MMLAREVGPDRMLRAMDDALSSGHPTAELVKCHLGGVGAPGDAFAVEHASLDSYDALIGGGGKDGHDG